MIANNLRFVIDWLLRFGESDELSRDCPTLMQQLVEAVLSVSSRLPEIHYCGLVGELLTCEVDTLTVALHIQLLDVWHELAECLAVW